MNAKKNQHEYTPTEAQYKDSAKEMYVTYDLEQETRGNNTAKYPKVERVYIAGVVKDWEVGDFERQSGRTVHGVKVEYEQSREGYERSGYTAHRDGTEYEVSPTRVSGSRSRFTKIVEVPEDAENVKFRGTDLPKKYQSALQDVR